MAMQQEEALPVETAPEPVASSDESAASSAPVDEAAQAEKERERIQQQLAQLERKQAELKRALAMANHPDLADALRQVEGRAYGVTRVEEQLAQPLSKGEERQRAKLEKKLGAAREKRAALDAQIAEIEAELGGLVEDRVAELHAQRQTALHQLFTVLAQHSDGFEAAGLKVAELIPELDDWLPELRTMAGDVADAE
ncbi:MAG: hypothetical protein RLP09_33035 [Sandaracinaceae bacterium]|nr:MAG: hypothetical protein EVA89_15315 [Sandaracinaceae bacterium]HBQ11321.1 hypothetical protein [Myxococcales bacterium]